MNSELERTAIVFTAMIETLEFSLKNDLFAEKISAFLSLLETCRRYRKEGFLPDIITEICRKKAEYIRIAKTKSELQAIMDSPAVRYDGNEVIPANKYCIPEEELIYWSNTSLLAPLQYDGLRRYEKLFKQIFPAGGII